MQESLAENIPLSSLEKKEAVMEQSRAERQKILDSFLNRITAIKLPSISSETQQRLSRVSDYVLGTYKMGAEAFRGKTLGGEKLSARDRLMYSLISATGILFQGLSTYAASTESKTVVMSAGVSYAAHWALFGIQKLPELKQVAQAAQPEVQEFVNSMEKIVEAYGRARVEDMAREIDAYGY